MKRDDPEWQLTRPQEWREPEEFNVPGQPQPIGNLIRDLKALTESQVEQIVTYQREHGTRFGEAAIALKLASREDVLNALARQYRYAYTPESPFSRKHSELVTANNPFGDEAEAFRELRSQLLMGVMSPDRQGPRNALAVLSQDIGDGKTYIAANLAVALSQLGGRTLLVDADMRTPRVHEVCGIDFQTGLSNILSGRADRNLVQQMPDIPGFYVLPVGGVPPNPLELVQRPVFDLLLRELLRKFDHVVVDTPAAVHGADARVIAAKCGAALLVGRRNSSRMDALKKLHQKLIRGSATIAGVVISEI